MSVFITAQGFDRFRGFIEALPDIAEQAAVLAVNQVTERAGFTAVKREMRAQVNFPTGYLEQGGRLRVGQRARRGNLVGKIVGRDRPTSLARFAPGATRENTRGGQGVRVQLKTKGGAKMLRKSFIVDLKNGNKGLAVRVKPGQTLENSEGAQKLGDDLYLLYGPSVDQLAQDVFEKQSPEILRKLEIEWRRQFTRLARG